MWAACSSSATGIRETKGYSHPSLTFTNAFTKQHTAPCVHAQGAVYAYEPLTLAGQGIAKSSFGNSCLQVNVRYKKLSVMAFAQTRQPKLPRGISNRQTRALQLEWGTNACEINLAPGLKCAHRLKYYCLELQRRVQWPIYAYAQPRLLFDLTASLNVNPIVQSDNLAD
jgi:hypothetical protein